jgi:hypothetical protein
LSEAYSAERLAQLEERWRREPSSRVFLQLAEEHRRGGHLERAVAVLEQGLVKHPGYVSALVLLGRCRLEAGDPPAAIEALERAVVHDPAQLVANKLLVEAYLATGRIEPARERIEFYRLFNDRDPEIDALERRIDAAAPPPAAAAASEVFDLPPASLPSLDLPIPAAARATAAGEPFGTVHDALDAGRRIEAAIAAEGIFPLAAPVAVAAETPKPAFGDVFDLSASPALAAPAAATVWEVEAPLPQSPAGELFELEPAGRGFRAAARAGGAGPAGGIGAVTAGGGPAAGGAAAGAHDPTVGFPLRWPRARARGPGTGRGRTVLAAHDRRGGRARDDRGALRRSSDRRR